MHIPFRVAYGVDKGAVREAVLRAAHAVPFTLKDTSVRKTQVWLIGFGESGLSFELVVWPALEAVKRPNASVVRPDLARASTNDAAEDLARGAELDAAAEVGRQKAR